MLHVAFIGFIQALKYVPLIIIGRGLADRYLKPIYLRADRRDSSSLTQLCGMVMHTLGDDHPAWCDPCDSLRMFLQTPPMLLLYGTADSGDMWERHNGADVDSFRHVVATCVIMPVAEEIAHHWVGLTVMCRVMPTIWARLLSSVIFGMIHNLEGDYYGDASRRVCTAVGSAILEQRLFLRYGLAASIAAHVTRNSLVGIVTDNNFSWDPWDERTSEEYYMRWLYVALPLWCISVFLNTVLTYHATRSVAVAVLVAVGFAVASKMYFPDVKPSPRPDRNYLAGHRYLTEEEYASEARDATDEALTCLVETDEYRAWVAKNHHRLGARVEPPDDEGDDGSDY